jgi:hypothetical protein
MLVESNTGGFTIVWVIATLGDPAGQELRSFCLCGIRLCISRPISWNALWRVMNSLVRDLVELRSSVAAQPILGFLSSEFRLWRSKSRSKIDAEIVDRGMTSPIDSIA